MQKKRSFPVEDEKEVREFVEKFTENEYHKKRILETLDQAKILAEYAKTVYIEITFDELGGKMYHDNARIFADGFTFNFLEYRNEWSFYVNGHRETLKKSYDYAPELSNYKLPKTLKKWSQKKYDSAIEYLTQYRKNLIQGEKDKISQLHSRAQVEEDVKKALNTEKMHRNEEETTIYSDLITATISGGGNISMQLHDYSIKNKIEFLRMIREFESKNNTK